MDRGQNYDSDEREEQKNVQPDRAFADGARAHRVPCGAGGDHGEFERQSAMSCRQAGRDAAEIIDEKRGIEGHFKNAACERQPGLLVTPEAAQATLNPYVEASFLGQGGGELADHQSGRKAPEQWCQGEDEERGGVTCLAD